jgi:copper(I)-binding protein
MRTICFVAFAALSSVAATEAATSPQITITDGWIRALPPSVPSGGYFTLHNGSAKDITLTSASSPACGMLMLHKSEDMGGMAHMQDVASVDVPSGGTIRFSPGGYHLMCMNATRAIQPGKIVPVILEFSDGAKIVSRFAVKNAAGN